MIKQGVVQEVLTDMAVPVPPLNNLPQWSRINTLDKARYPKPFLKDRLQPLPQPPPMERQTSQGSTPDKELEVSEKMNPGQRIKHLERSIQFLQHQHQEVLGSLHHEIDTLKQDNKDLNFQMVMVKEAGGVTVSSASSSKREHRRSSGTTGQRRGVKGTKKGAEPDPQEDERVEELKIIFLEQEIKELKKALRDEKIRSHDLAVMVEEGERLKHLNRHWRRSSMSARLTERISQHEVEQMYPKPASASQASSRDPAAALATKSGPVNLPYNATLKPLLVHLPEQNPRPPTLKECEILIEHLQHYSDMQTHELNQLKSDLRDVLYSHKWTPDAYLLAKAYIAEDDSREEAGQTDATRLPRLSMKQPSRKLPDVAYLPRDVISLPALKQTVGTKAVERRKRTQILQKARFRREVLH